MTQKGTELTTLNKSYTNSEKQFVEKKIMVPPIHESELFGNEYVKSGNQPQIPFSNILLVLIPALLISAQIRISSFFQLPILEYLYVTLLISFLGNYYIIRTHDLYPYLPQNNLDNKLKIISFLAIAVIITTISWGWNGSGGIIFSIGWEMIRGKGMGVLFYGFFIVILGMILFEGNYTVTKIYEFIPGIIIGYIYSNVYTLKSSSTYTIYHQISLISCIFLPIFFPIQHLVKPTLIQWIVLIVGGALTEFTGLLLIKMMQNQKPSVGIAVMSAIIMLLTHPFMSGIYIFYGVLIILGSAFLLKKHYSDGE